MTHMVNVGVRSICLLGLALAAGLALAGCGQAQRGSPTDGRVVAGQYTNSFFGFAMTLPAGWTTASNAVLEQVQRSGLQTLANANRDQELKRKIEASAQSSHQLLLASEKPWGTATTSNPSLIVAAEKLSPSAGMRTGQDYLAHVSR